MPIAELEQIELALGLMGKIIDFVAYGSLSTLPELRFGSARCTAYGFQRTLLSGCTGISRVKVDNTVVSRPHRWLTRSCLNFQLQQTVKLARVLYFRHFPEQQRKHANSTILISSLILDALTPFPSVAA